MNIKDNPYTSISYSIFGGKNNTLGMRGTYRIEIGPYKVWLPYYGYHATWTPNKFVDGISWSKIVSANHAKHFYNILLNGLKNPYWKGTRLLKNVHSKTFEEGFENHIVYSYKGKYGRTKRVYIRFVPITMESKGISAYRTLPKIGPRLEKDANYRFIMNSRKNPILKNMDIFN